MNNGGRDFLDKNAVCLAILVRRLNYIAEIIRAKTYLFNNIFFLFFFFLQNFILNSVLCYLWMLKVWICRIKLMTEAAYRISNNKNKSKLQNVCPCSRVRQGRSRENCQPIPVKIRMGTKNPKI